MMPPERAAERAEEIAANLGALGRRIDEACRCAGRDPKSVELLPVTKYFPESDIAILHELGLRTFGESRPQELRRKAEFFADLPDLRWRLIGRLQRNKVRAVARWAHSVDSVDSVRLVDALESAVGAAVQSGERSGGLAVLVQISLDGDPARGGVPAAGLAAVADRVAQAENLFLKGLLAVPPRDQPPAEAFSQLALLHTRFRREYPGADELSAGMSQDLDTAIAHGSTCVRVGTALLGPRPIASP